MEIIISAPHLLIAADIKCQTSFDFSRIKRRISFLCLRKVATLSVLLSLLFDIQFPSHFSTVGEINMSHLKRGGLYWCYQSMVRGNLDDRSFKLFLMWRFWAEGQQSHQGSPDFFFTSTSSSSGKTLSFSHRRDAISVGCPGSAPSSLSWWTSFPGGRMPEPPLCGQSRNISILSSSLSSQDQHSPLISTILLLWSHSWQR